MILSTHDDFYKTLALLCCALITLASCVRETPEALVRSAKDYAARNESRAAIIQLKNALQKKPDFAEARFMLGKLLLATGDAAGAEKELRKARELNYPSEQVTPPLATALVAIGEHQKVLNELGGTRVNEPVSKAELQTAVGYAQLKLGNEGAARAAFATALDAQPQYVPAHLAQARIAGSSGDLGKALSMVETALALAPSVPEAWQLKGDILRVQGELDAALSAYGKALQVRPDFLPAHNAVVLLLMRQNKLDEAGGQIEAMKGVAPKHPQTFYVEALHAYREKKLPAAEQAIQQALSADPDNLIALLLSAVIKLESQAYAQSEAHAQKVLARLPTQPLARRVLTMGYLRRGEPAKAVATLKPALDSGGNSADLFVLAGEAYMMNGEPEQAARYFSKAAQLEPANLGTRTALARSHLALGETDRAFAELENTAAADSGVRADLALIAAHLQRRAYDRALAAIAALEKKQPHSAMPHNLRGGVLLAKRDVVGARRSFARALELEPYYFPAAASLARLDMAENKPEDARQRLETVLAHFPKHINALLALAELRRASGGSVPEVAALIDKAVAAQPDQATPRLALINHYLVNKDTRKAVIASQDAMAAVRDNLAVMGAAARAYEAAGETNQALSIYGRMAKLQPASPQPYLRMAGAQLEAKNKDKALESLREALTLKPDLVEAQRGMIGLHIESGRVQEALTVAREVQRQRPKQPIGYIFEGDIHVEHKNWTEAAKAYRAGLRHAPSGELAVRLHMALAAAGDRPGADQVASTWLKSHPKDRLFLIHLAQQSVKEGQYAVAAQHYAKVVETEPENPVMLNNLAWVSAQIKAKQALGYAEKAFALAPTHPAIMDTLGLLLVEKGETTRGLELLRKASASAPQSPDIRLNLVKGLISAGQREAARKELDELSKLGDKFSAQAEVGRLRNQL